MADELARLDELVRGLETDQKKEKDEALNLIKSIKGFFENRFEKSIPQQLKQAMLSSSAEEEIPAEDEISETIIDVIIPPVDLVNIPNSAEKKKKKKKKKSKASKQAEKVDQILIEPIKKELSDSHEINEVVMQIVQTEVKIEVIAPLTK